MKQHNLYINRNPVTMPGKLIITGTRIKAELIMRKLASGYPLQERLEALSTTLIYKNKCCS